jgi:ABC-type glycerol-3-phosphate transport system substrate-binding protein
MRKTHKISAIFIAAIMLLTVLVSCKKAESETAAAQPNAVISDTGVLANPEKIGGVNYLFDRTDLIVSGGYNKVFGSCFYEDEFYILANRSEMTNPDEYIFYTDILRIDESGETIKKAELAVSYSDKEPEETAEYTAFGVLEGFGVCAVKTIKTTLDGREKTNYLITVFDKDLNEKTLIDLSEPADFPAFSEASEPLVISDFIADKNGNIYLRTYGAVYVLSGTAKKFLFSVTNQNSVTGLWFDNLIMTDEGVAVITREAETKDGERVTKARLSLIDTEKKDFGESYDLPFGKTSGIILRGSETAPIIISGGAKLTSFEPKSGGFLLIADLLASGLDIYPDNLMVISEDKFAFTTTEFASETDSIEAKIILLTRKSPNESAARQIVNVSLIDRDGNFSKFAAEFNRNNTSVQININAYYDIVEGNREARLTRLNSDLISGNVPDILIISGEMPFENFAAKGLFSDLSGYLQKDSEINYGDMNKAALAAFSQNGKIYSIAASYSVFGFFADESLMGGGDVLTAEKMFELTKNHPDSVLFGATDRDDFVSGIVALLLESFIDRETGETSFNSPEFIKLLETAKLQPETISGKDDDYFQMQYRDGKSLIMSGTFSDFFTVPRISAVDFGKKTALLKLPWGNSAGYLMFPETELTMMSGGNNDAAWEVIKAYLKREAENESSFSVYNSVNKKAAEEAKKPLQAIDETTGELVDIPNVYQSGNLTVTIPDITDSDNAAALAAIDEIVGVRRIDNNLMKIIEEEISAYFAGAKTAEECAALIENRAEIYIAESN